MDLYACMYVCMYRCNKAHSDTHGSVSAGPRRGACSSALAGVLSPSGYGVLGSAAMDAFDRSTTSPRNKIQTGQGLRFFWYAVWTIHLFSVTSGLPPQGSPAPTIASGRTALPADLLYQNSTKRYSVDALGAGLYLDTPGRVRLTGSSTIRLFAAWQINWAHNFSGSLLPSRLHPILASGACSCSVTATHGLLPQIRWRSTCLLWRDRAPRSCRRCR